MPVSHHTRNNSKDYKDLPPGKIPTNVTSSSPSNPDGNPKDPEDNELTQLQKQNKNINSSLQTVTTLDQPIQEILQQLVALNQSLLTRVDNLALDYRTLDSKIKTLEDENLLLASNKSSDEKVPELEAELTAVKTSYAQDDKVASIEQDLADLKLAIPPTNKVASIEQDLADLKLAIPPPKKRNKPSITDLSTVPAPPQSTFLLASKTVKLMDLHNTLIHLKFKSDSIDHIKHMYAMLRQAIDIGCGTTFLLLDIEHEIRVPDFFSVMVPP